MDFDEVNRELDANRNNVSDYAKAMNDKIWHEILSGFANGDIPDDYQIRGYRPNSLICDDSPTSPQDTVESLLDKTRPIYHDRGLKPPANPVGPQGPSIFVSPWIYHEILAVLADIDHFEQAKKTRWARLRKIDKMRRKLPVVKESAIYTTYTRTTSMPQYPYITWIS